MYLREDEQDNTFLDIESSGLQSNFISNEDKLERYIYETHNDDNVENLSDTLYHV